MVTGGKLQLKGETYCPALHIACRASSLCRASQSQYLLHCILMSLHIGGNPWDVKKKKAKKTKAIKVEQAEEGDVRENGDVRTKGCTLSPCHSRMPLTRDGAPQESRYMSFYLSLKPACCHADGKIIKAASVSVQSNRTYEQEFALEMQKAQVCPPFVALVSYAAQQSEVL